MFWGLLLLLIMSDHTESNNTPAVNENNYFLRLKTKEKNMKMDKRLKQAIWKNLIYFVSAAEPYTIIVRFGYAP